MGAVEAAASIYGGCSVRYLRIPVAAGRHRLATTESLLGNDTGKTRGEAVVTAPAGSTLYLRYTEGFSSFVPIPLAHGALVVSSGKYRFEAVPEKEALSELANTQAID